jgi:hypothetical protein
MKAQIPQKIRINLMLRMRLAQAGPRINGFQPHLLHQPLNPLPVHPMTTPSQKSGHLPGTIKRSPGILLINQLRQQQSIGGNYGLIINTRSGDPQELRLVAKRNLGILFVNEQKLLFMGEGQIYF